MTAKQCLTRYETVFCLSFESEPCQKSSFELTSKRPNKKCVCVFEGKVDGAEEALVPGDQEVDDRELWETDT